MKRRSRTAQVPLWGVVVLSLLGLLTLGWWTYLQTRSDSSDGRKTLVFWGTTYLGEDIYNLIHEFEQANPQYRVVMSSAAARDTTGDAQRLLCAIAGGVPPDVVWFDRFAIGEWAARGALTDLRPMLAAQDPSDPYFIRLEEYYDWTIAEASYAPPGSDQPPGIYGIPCSADVRAFFVNTDILRQGGYVDERGEPLPPRTWEELREYANRLTVYRVPGDKRSGIVRLGFAPNVGNSWLYMYAWQAGGELMNPQRTAVTMTSPPVIRALRYMVEVYDELGGVGQVNAFQEAQQGGDLDPFLRGALAMKIDGDVFIEAIADWRPNMELGVYAPPMPADRLAAGAQPVTWSGGFAYVIPATARHKEGAFKFIQFLTSEHGYRLLERGRRERKQSEGRLYLPRCNGNRRLYEAIVRETVDQNPDVPRNIKLAYKTFRELLPITRIRPVTPIGQLLWNQHVRAYDAAVNHAFREQAQRSGKDEVELALAAMQVDAQRELDNILKPAPARKINWTPVFWAYGTLVVLPFIAMYVAYRRRRREYAYRAREVGAALTFASPWIFGFVALVGGPILFSIVFSFTQYDVLSPARAVGLANYREVLSDGVFYKSLFNTAFMVIQIPIGMAVSLAIALLLNHTVRGIGFYRAGFYLPVVMPLVATSLLWIWLLNPSYGAINTLLSWLYATPPMQWIEALLSRIIGQPFHFPLPLWLQHPDWSKPSIIVMNLWKAGGGMIIWLAGLQSIPQQLYEAASIDGAGPWRRFRHITLPMLSPFILFNLIIGLIGTMQIFGEAYIMTFGGPADSTLFYAFYLFKQAFQYFRMGYASALAWILFLIVLALTVLQLWLSSKWVHYERA
ncbi:extracellular solute-binding protein [Fontivita pretiosa]|uniref:extracellular solute-binding protein n=1 Tax=Fontivita pretiosa TaxID=2989684 RepID=UPI003D176D5C